MYLFLYYMGLSLVGVGGGLFYVLYGWYGVVVFVGVLVLVGLLVVWWFYCVLFLVNVVMLFILVS